MRERMTNAEMARLHDEGLSYEEIAAYCGLTRAAVKARIARAREQDASDPPRIKKAPRKCLCCGTMFLSHGPGNRMCARCRERAADLSPYAL